MKDLEITRWTDEEGELALPTVVGAGAVGL
jgi:hypothetical protein